MNTLYYAGIGSRSTPPEILGVFEYLGEWLARHNCTLRSGGANGADSAFERGCDKAAGQKEIYLPWKRFNENASPLYTVGPRALKIAREVHPAWDRLGNAAQLLMGRNTYQVMGNVDWQSELAAPLSSFIICYTDDGKLVGGTAQAIRLANREGVPVFNFGAYENVSAGKAAFNKFWKEINENLRE